MQRIGSDYTTNIRAGRAYVRLFEAAVLIEWEVDERAARALERMRHHY